MPHYDTSSLYIEMPIPYSAHTCNARCNKFLLQSNGASAKNMQQHIETSKKIYILELCYKPLMVLIHQKSIENIPSPSPY